MQRDHGTGRNAHAPQYFRAAPGSGVQLRGRHGSISASDDRELVSPGGGEAL
jgi:hypothetical protein